ncbi:hypothetical protein [Dactylosporangium sp. NPDC051484]|uniref:hypothetical protein n=1 Tax=Dactylosporangium sp. NPDC051484 TaxID=3154942 RepID=UPI00344C2D5C
MPETGAPGAPAPEDGANWGGVAWVGAGVAAQELGSGAGVAAQELGSGAGVAAQELGSGADVAAQELGSEVGGGGAAGVAGVKPGKLPTGPGGCAWPNWPGTEALPDAPGPEVGAPGGICGTRGGNGPAGGNGPGRADRSSASSSGVVSWG